jgi:hypothetical protein
MGIDGPQFAWEKAQPPAYEVDPAASLTEKHKQLVADAASCLAGGERVLAVTTGSIPVRRLGQDSARNGTLIATDRRVILFTKKMGGYDVQDFAYGLLTSVDHKVGMVFGNLDLAASGDRSRISLIPKVEIEHFAQMVRHQMAATRNVGAPGTSSSGQSVAGEIRQLAALRDDGLITEDEFQAKKRQLLGL